MNRGKDKNIVNKPVYANLLKTYRPFAYQYLHPLYMFFFSPNESDIKSINSKMCSLTKEYFRGTGLESVGSRKLAVLLGGSSAFGWFASCDDKTITGFLNVIQDEYFFINAGVPSWNSWQELVRLINQILPLHPALVIIYDGANDINVSKDYFTKNLILPNGTPENFDKLLSITSTIKGNNKSKQSSITRKLFPNIISFFETKRYRITNENKIENTIYTAAQSYIYNHKTMYLLCQFYGIRFISIFQPILWLHKNITYNKKLYNREALWFVKFHNAVCSTKTEYERLDFSSFFESMSDQIPPVPFLSETDVGDKTIFVDEVHLYDEGNRLIANAIVNYLQKSVQNKK